MYLPKSRLIPYALAACVLITSSCGTIIHPERVGQPRTGRLDTSVVLLNGLGLLFFVVPGIIAFVIDFGTGAIYLPPGYGDTNNTDWHVVHVPPDELTPTRIRQVILQETGEEVDLSDDSVQIEKLQSINEAEGRISTLD